MVYPLASIECFLYTSIAHTHHLHLFKVNASFYVVLSQSKIAYQMESQKCIYSNRKRFSISNAREREKQKTKC